MGAIAAVFGCLAVLVVSARAQIPVVRDVQAGENSMEARIRFPAGYFEYRGKRVEAGQPLKNFLFGLSFQRPRKTNGGWSLWDFLDVGLLVDGTPLPIMRNILLKDVDILENGGRLLLRFRWQDTETGTRLDLLAAWYPELPDWIFLNIKCAGPLLFLDYVTLKAYPGNTSGPKERERWFAAGEMTRRLSNRPTALPVKTEGIVFFNKMAQNRDGLLLVSGGNPLRDLTVVGTYGVSAKALFADDQTNALYAIGGFEDDRAEEVIRVFKMEGARNIRNFLKDIDWSPDIDIRRSEMLLKDIEELLAETDSESGQTSFQDLKKQYAASRESEDRSALVDVIAQLRDLKLRLITIELSKLR